MTAGSTITCPDALRTLPAWCIWRLEHAEGETKRRKVPYYAAGGKRHGVQGRPEDCRQLTTFDAALSAAARRGYDGVGFCPLPEWGIVALDFDNVIGPDGAIHPDVERLVSGTYAEVSPSGNGVRAFFRGDVGNRKDHGAPFGYETFSTKGFVTLTGRVLPCAEFTDHIADLTPEVLAYCATRFGRSDPASETSTTDVAPLGLTQAQLRELLAPLDPSMGHDPWLKVGMALHHETSGEGFELWDEWSATSGKYSSSDALRARWDSFGRGGQRPTTANLLMQMSKGAPFDISRLYVDDFDVIAPEAAVAAEAAKPLKYRPVSASEFVAQPLPGWIVRDVVPNAGVMMIYGESKAGKSFVTLDLFAAVARGVDWRGKRVRQGSVLYIAAEGAGGFRKRVKAYGQAHGVNMTEFPFHIIAAAPNLLKTDEAVEVARAAQAVGPVAVIIVDTLAQVTPGSNENTSDGVGMAIRHCQQIHEVTGALVVLVHHAGKDATKGARGWSGLGAAVDASIEVARLPTGRMLKLQKQKDGEDDLQWGFELERVSVGQDEDGGEATSCVVRAADAPVREPVAKLGKWQRAVHAAVAEADPGVGVSKEQLVTTAIQCEAPPEPPGRDKRAERVASALDTLLDRGVLEVVDGFYRIA
jgi:hypothetical protein